MTLRSARLASDSLPLPLAPILLAFCLACGVGESDSGSRPDLILISIDTLRADRLGAYGYDRDTSPTLDALAARGVRFETVIAESNWTLPSHMTLFTGLPPSYHGVTEARHKLRSTIETLAEVLRDNGYRTFGVNGGGFLDARYGFSRGFERYALHAVDFPMALRMAARRIERFGPDERFFWFIHTYEVHCPYDPPSGYAERFESRPPEDHLETRARCGKTDFNRMSLTPGQAAFLSDRYDAGIRYADDLLKGFLDRLDRAGRLSNTVIAVVSDHGEEFLEHGQIGHRDTQYIESLRVPWILAGPGLEPRVVTGAVGLADVMPTLLDLLGIPAPKLRGRSRRAEAAGSVSDEPKAAGSVSDKPKVAGSVSDEPEARFSEDSPAFFYSVVRGDRHLIWKRDTNEYRLFDWRADPRETENLRARDPEADGDLQALLDREVQRRSWVRHLHAPELTPEVDAPQRARLRALGYAD